MTLTKHVRRIEVEEDEAAAIFEEEADFGRYAVLLWRWLPLVAGAALVCGAIASLIAFNRPTEYEATSTLAVSGVPNSRHIARNGVFGFVAGGTLAALGLAMTVALRDTLKRAKAA